MPGLGGGGALAQGKRFAGLFWKADLKIKLSTDLPMTINFIVAGINM